MKVLIDGVEYPCQNDVTVIYEDQLLDTSNGDEISDIDGQLHCRFNCEGLVLDFIPNGWTEGSHPSAYQLITDLLELVH